MESVFRTPEKGAKSAPAKILMVKSEQMMNVSSRKCLFPDKTWRSKDASDDDDMEKSTVVDTYLKPSSFYGNSAPISKTDFPKVSRTDIDSNNYKSRVRLFHDGSLKRKRSCGGGGRRSLSSHHKRPKNEIYTGVSHSIKPRKPVVGKKKSLSKDSPHSDVSPTRSSPKTPSNAQFESPNKTDNILFHDSLLHTTRKTPRSKKRSLKQDSPYPWSMKFTKARREEVVSEGEGTGKKRKFFKSGKSPISPYNVILPEKTKRRKLLSSEQDASFIFKQLGTASDILDLIEDGRVIDEHDERREENVSKLIGQLDDENDENMPVDNVLDITETTGNLSITDSPQSSLSTPQKMLGVTPLRSSPRRSPRKRTPTKLFSIFDPSSPKKFTDISNISATKLSSHSKKGAKSTTPVKLRPISSNQLQIDVGQKKLGEKVCPTCSLVYQMGDPDDEVLHEKYHNSHALFKFLGWQNERLIRRYSMDRVILVLPGDQKAWWDRVKSLLQVIDNELGYLPEELHPETQFLMYISNKRIVGCLAALPVIKAYKMLMSESDIDMCSEESYPVRCAVSRIWTHRNVRKTGIGSKLMDCLRSSFLPGEYLGVDDVSFSVPTVEGRIFAQKYTKREDYLVYTGW